MTQPDPRRPYRPDIMARRHVAASGHYFASLAAFSILEAGGNAVDAGVAAGIATNVLQSEFTGFGGVAPTMIRLAESGRVVTISGVGPWPKAVSCEDFRRRHGGRVPRGILHTVVPAAAGIWIAALARHGTMRFGEVAAFAIRFARDGFPMYPMMAERLAETEADWSRYPTTRRVFAPCGAIPAVGEIFVQGDLGRTLQYMADEESAHIKNGRTAGLRAAHDAFYRGDVAAAIVRHHHDNGGLLTAEDLADFEAVFEEPQRIRYGELEVYGCGPWCQGPMILEALNILEGIDLRRLGHNSPAYVHAVVEALKLAAADREAYFGDPAFVSVPLETLLSKHYARERRTRIRDDRASPGMPPAGAVSGFAKEPWAPDPSSGDGADAPGRTFETSYLCVADGAGNVFSATPSDPTVAGAVVEGTGITPSQWGSRAYTDPGHPAAIGPGRRPRMSANPMMIVEPGRSIMAVGSPGSEVLGQSQLQVLLNRVVFGMSPQAAVEAPRFASYSWPASALPHEYHPGRLALETDLGAETGAALSRLGHDVVWWPTREWRAGSVCTLSVDLTSGFKIAGADHRLTAYAVGW